MLLLGKLIIILVFLKLKCFFVSFIHPGIEEFSFLLILIHEKVYSKVFISNSVLFVAYARLFLLKNIRSTCFY